MNAPAPVETVNVRQIATYEGFRVFISEDHELLIQPMKGSSFVAMEPIVKTNEGPALKVDMLFAAALIEIQYNKLHISKHAHENYFRSAGHAVAK